MFVWMVFASALSFLDEKICAIEEPSIIIIIIIITIIIINLSFDRTDK